LISAIGLMLLNRITQARAARRAQP